MKILMLTSSLDIGGAETHIVELSLQLKRYGEEVFVVSSGGEYSKRLKEEGVGCFFLPLKSKSPLSLLGSYFSLKKIIKENKIDVLHSHARLPSFIANILSKKMNVPFITTAHWVFSTVFYKKLLTRWGDKTIAVSEDIKEYLIKNYDIEKSDITVTVNGINTQEFKNEYIEKSLTTIACVSRIDKGRSRAAFALTEIANELYQFRQDIEILIIGGGDLEGELRALAEKENQKIGKNIVKFVGRTTNVQDYLKNCDVFVGVSRAALEALACECNAILAGDEGYAGIFEKNKIDTLIKNNFCCRGERALTKEELLFDIKIILSYDKEKLKELGGFNRSFVKENYSLERMASDALFAYREAKKNKNRRVVICGYYGLGNIGDEAILSNTISMLREIGIYDITVISSNKNYTKRVHGVEAVYKYDFLKIISILKKGGLFLLGGGNLLQNQTSTRSLLYYYFMLKVAKMQNNKCIIFSSGIGDIYGTFAKSISKKALKLCDGIFLRTENDIKKCKSIDAQLDPKLCCDLALLTKEENFKTDTRKIQDKYFLVILRRTKKCTRKTKQILAKNIEEIALQRKLIPVFVSMHPSQDDKISKEIANKCINAKFLDCKGISDFISLAKNAEFGIGMRLHALVFCFFTNTPFVLLNYDRKCNDMFFHLSTFLKKHKLQHKCIVRANTDELSDSVKKLKDKKDVSAVFKKATEELAKNNLEFYLYLENLINM